MQVNVLEARNQLSQLIRTVQGGGEVVIANRGEPVARLVAANDLAKRRPAPPRDFVQWLERHPLPAHAQRSAEAIDAGIAAERDAWD